MHKTGKKLLSVLLALAMVFSLLPGVVLNAAAEDAYVFVEVTSTPTEETLANMINFDEAAAWELYNSAEFQDLAPEGLCLIYNNVGEEEGEYMTILNLRGEPEIMSVGLSTLGMIPQMNGHLYYVTIEGYEPPPTPSNPTVYYRYYTLNTDDWTITPTVDSTNEYSLITDSSTTWTTWEEGWYVVDGNVVITDGVYLTGTVRLILCDGASLTVNGGIMSQIPGCKLIVYPGVMESGAKTAPTIEGTGALNALSTEDYMPGIGYTTEVEIHGGTVYAVGTEDAAGIGGAPYADGSLLIMYDGTLTAIGGTNGAGIGGSTHYSGGNVSIYGGTVTAIGGENAAGIGAGANGSSDGTLNYNSEGILLETSDDNLNCSVYSDAAPRGRYMRAQVQEEPPSGVPSADAGFSEDFEGTINWTLVNGDLYNRWIVGEAVSNGGSKSLYISNNESDNQYDTGWRAFVLTRRLVSFDGGLYDFSYDWRCMGESKFDYLRVVLIPEDVEVSADGFKPSGFTESSLPSGWIAVDGGGKLNLQSEWQNQLVTAEVPQGNYWMTFTWANDNGSGTQPPAAVDNFRVAPHVPEPQTVDVFVVEQSIETPSDVRIWAWGSAGDVAPNWDSRPSMEYQGSDAVVNREGVNGEPYSRPYYKFTLNVDDYGDGLLFTAPYGQTQNLALTEAQKEAGFAVFYMEMTDENADANAGDDVWKLVSHTDANCLQPSVDVYEGLLTGQVDTIARNDALGHDFTVLVEDHPASCTEGGYQIYKCSRCDAVESRPVEALGHDFSALVEEHPATCTEEGYKVYKCTRCDETEIRDQVEALGHDYEAVVTEPSCTEGGYTTYTCTRCGDSYEDDFTEPLGHDFSALVEEHPATCTEEGYKVYKCSRCDETEIRDRAEALGHDFSVLLEQTLPTCTELGFELYQCSRCEETENRPVAATGHTLELIPAVEPSCTEAGATVGVRCTVCGEVLIQPAVIAPKGHDYGEPAWSWNEDCTAASASFVCAVCGDEQVLEAELEEEVLSEALPHIAGEKLVTATVVFEDESWIDEQLVELPALPCPCETFVDMPEYGTPEHEAIEWAFENGVTSGMNATHFGTGATLTRAQAATFLWAASGKPEIDGDALENPFEDVSEEAWYAEYVKWACAQGLFSGYEDGTFRPNNKLTRTEILQILYAWAGKPSVSGVSNPYVDVEGKWFKDAALWAYSEGIEQGENGVFGQRTKVPRETFVLYLYRYLTGNQLLNGD